MLPRFTGIPCLTVYTEEEWQRIVERSKAAPSSKARGLRTFFANVVRCEPDKQGRFLLPDDLRKYAGIQQEVYFLGQAGRAEIWAASATRRKRPMSPPRSWPH